MSSNPMEFWFEEMHTNNVKMAIRVNKHLYSDTSEFQRIDVFESPEFGKFLTSNGNVIFSEQEEFTYDEMIVHVPMAVHPDVKRVLVIGGGDGGVARELSHYKEIEVIDIAEPDKMFVDVCRKYFPDNAIGLEDVRVRLSMILLSTMLRIPRDMRRDSLQRSSTVTASRLSTMTGSWYISTEALSLTKMKRTAVRCTGRL